MELLIVTGMSGSGKSSVMDVMEDIGYYCIDNIPPMLISQFVDLCRQSETAIDKIAAAVDIRSGDMFAEIFRSWQKLKANSAAWAEWTAYRAARPTPQYPAVFDQPEDGPFTEEIRNEDGSLRQALFLFDSNDYIDGDIARYDYIHDDQVDWYESEVLRLSEREGRTIPSLAFFHIPLPEYRTAFDLYEAGSTAVTYFFGSNEERVAQKVCCSEHPCALFDRIVALGSTTGTFCGHDHYNNISLRYRGVRLTYGMSIDYLAMPGISRDTAQRGAELITLLEDGSWTLRRIPLLSLLDN